MKQHRSNRNSRKRPQTSSHIPVSEQYSNNSQEDARRVATNQEDKDMCRTMKELERVVADYRSMKAMKEQIDAEVKSLEYEIIGYMDANEKLTETGNDFTIKLSTCERRTVDTKRLEADLGSLAEYQRISQYRRLYVK